MSEMFKLGRDEENQLIVDYFSNTPYKFLCIGSGNGDDHLFPLLSRGWTGIYCEPSPADCLSLIEFTKPFINQVTIINSAVMSTSGLKPIYLCTNTCGTSSLIHDWREVNKPRVPDPIIRQIVTNTITAVDLITFVGTDIALVSIDAEGSDSEIVKSIPWKQLSQCQMVFVEEIDKKAEKILFKNNFVLSCTTNINQNNVYVKEIK